MKLVVDPHAHMYSSAQWWTGGGGPHALVPFLNNKIYLSWKEKNTNPLHFFSNKVTMSQAPVAISGARGSLQAPASLCYLAQFSKPSESTKSHMTFPHTLIK
jgi:hypothetical protein